MDPRFKLLPWMPESKKKQIQERVVQKLLQSYERGVEESADAESGLGSEVDQFT